MQVQNLRVYERRGLVDPDRTPGGTRLYSRNDLHQLARIRDLLAEGLNLAASTGYSPWRPGCDASSTRTTDSAAKRGSDQMTDDVDRVKRIAELAGDRKVRVVTSESLTTGTVATRLGAGPDAADWFGGGIVAYQEPVKFDVLGVEEGPVVTAACARQMATGARRPPRRRRGGLVHGRGGT